MLTTHVQNTQTTSLLRQRHSFPARDMRQGHNRKATPMIASTACPKPAEGLATSMLHFDSNRRLHARVRRRILPDPHHANWQPRHCCHLITASRGNFPQSIRKLESPSLPYDQRAKANPKHVLAAVVVLVSACQSSLTAPKQPIHRRLSRTSLQRQARKALSTL